VEVKMIRSTIQEEGQRRLVQRLLERKFGPLPPEAVQRLEALRPEELEEVAWAYPDASSLAELNLTDRPAGEGSAPAGA
jgi:hypothetical protein